MSLCLRRDLVGFDTYRKIKKSWLEIMFALVIQIIELAYAD